MKNKIKPYLTFTKNSLERSLAYRANSIIFILGDVIILLVTFYLWLAIYGSSNDSVIKGFSVNEMMVYVVLSFVTSAITQADLVSAIYREVKDGSIAAYLIKPIDYGKRMFFENLGTLIYNYICVFLLGFSIVLFLTFKYNIKLTVASVVLYFVSSSLGFLVNFFFGYSFGLLAFKITNMWGMSQIVQAIFQLLSGALIPLTFFPGIIQKLLNFLPFKSIIYAPCMIYLGKFSNSEIIFVLAVQIIWVIILYFISKAIWNALIKQLTIIGG